MRVFIVVGHPEVESLNYALRDRAVEILESDGHEVRVSDLVQDGFSPILTRSDFPAHPPGKPVRPMRAQQDAAISDSVSEDIRREQDRLRWCDLVVLQFPVWWGSYPAVIKGWIDRVLAYGFAYGRGRTLPTKMALYSVTVGSGVASELDEDKRRVAHLASDVFGYMGWDVLEPILTLGARELPPATRMDNLERFETQLADRLELAMQQRAGTEEAV